MNNKTIKSSGLIDTRLYDDSLFLAHILNLLDGQINEAEKELLKAHFLKKDELSIIPNECKKCLQHPSNGGSGV